MQKRSIPKKKDMNYYQAMKYFQLEPYGDVDNDGVRNFLDCRPFNSDEHFLKFKDIKAGFEKIKSGLGSVKHKFEKPLAEPRKQLSRAPKPTKYKPKGQIYLYVKSNGVWSLYGGFDEGSALLTDTVRGLYSQGKIEAHEFSNKSNQAGRLNRAEKIKPVLEHTGKWVEATKKHMREEDPKLIKSYQQRIGFTKGELGRRIGEGLAIKPQAFASSRYTSEPEIEDELEIEPALHEIEPELEEEPEIETGVAPEYEPPASIRMPQSREEPIIIEPQQGPSGAKPPMSVGWYGSLAGSRPYRPLPYKPVTLDQIMLKKMPPAYKPFKRNW